ncbi:MAG: cupin domain-containing protein [Saprospiraceae bacterium]
MNIPSFNTELEFNESKPAIRIILETSFTKEIRILFKEGQLMKKHQTPFPIIVQILEGTIDFGVSNNTLNLRKGDIVTLEGAVPHDLLAKEDSVVRLTLSKSDSLKRVKQVTE